MVIGASVGSGIGQMGFCLAVLGKEMVDQPVEGDKADLTIELFEERCVEQARLDGLAVSDPTDRARDVVAPLGFGIDDLNLICVLVDEVGVQRPRRRVVVTVRTDHGRPPTERSGADDTLSDDTVAADKLAADTVAEMKATSSWPAADRPIKSCSTDRPTSPH
jgi:hypothetical protein